MSTPSADQFSPGCLANLEKLLFTCTNPSNKIDDVNTIKRFCDAVAASNPDGAVVACRLLAHKVQSPQEREAVQALAVLEACMKSCGEDFHAEVGRFKFLNELIKLISPRYLADRTPEHIKRKVVELLYIWSRELREEQPKIREAYEMLKKQEVIKADPEYVGEAVFAAALPPRRCDAPLSDEKSRLLKSLLQSKNPEDLQRANKIIKGMVKDDEKKMDALTRRSSELVTVGNNCKLLNEMLDHYDAATTGADEVDLLGELFDSCEKMRSQLFRLGAETEDEDGPESLARIVEASEELTRVVDRYKSLIIRGEKEEPVKVNKPVVIISNREKHSNADSLLDLDPLGQPQQQQQQQQCQQPPSTSPALLLQDFEGPAQVNGLNSSNHQQHQQQPSIDDLLSSSGSGGGNPGAIPALLVDALSQAKKQQEAKSPYDLRLEADKCSRARGLMELDNLGEAAILTHLDSRSPQFAKRNEKLSMQQMQLNQKPFQVNDLTSSLPEPEDHSSSTPRAEPDFKPLTPDSKPPNPNSKLPNPDPKPSNPDTRPSNPDSKPPNTNSKPTNPDSKPTTTSEEVKLSEIEVSLSEIKPGGAKPVYLQNPDEGVSVQLHFGRDRPRPGVSAIVVTFLNKTADEVTDLELKAVVPKGCKVKLGKASGSGLPPHNPFVPPSAVTQVMLVANPKEMPVTVKYVLSYNQDGEPQTEMGESNQLPI